MDHRDGRAARSIALVGRGSILLMVYTASSMGIVQEIWVSVDGWQLVTVAVVATVLLAVALVFTRAAGQLARLDRGDKIVPLFCGSKKSLVSGLPLAPVLFPSATVGLSMFPLMLFHRIQLVVCSVIASRLGREQAAESRTSQWGRSASVLSH
jgi:sodium/bile acid cotransporter 7